jgi:spermidine synthase
MLLHPDPQNALVICFGTGQTANAVRQEEPKSLDVVDVNPRVFKLAHNFFLNQSVLDDPRVKPTVMDGRAYLRRVAKAYDVITLEPMPPNFAGMNALYSREFYELARLRLGPDGMIAQWMPLRHVAPHYSASIARTFQSVFPNAILWIEPVSQTGILLGTVNDDRPLGADWPGFKRTAMTYNLTEDQVRNAVLMDRKQLRRYGENGEIISDDNQLLAYGDAVYAARFIDHLLDENFDLFNRVR